MMYALARDPRHRVRVIRTLLDVPHEAQKASTAAVLGVPYTPLSDRPHRCAAASALNSQVDFNEWMLHPGPDNSATPCEGLSLQGMLDR